MSSSLSDIEIDFIQKNLSEDVNKLLLSANKFKGLDIKKLASQILARQKAAKKLPQWCGIPELLFPPPLSVEQASSEATAIYKSSLMRGESLVDITGGTGIDIFYMSRNFGNALYLEMNPDVWESAIYNFEKLKADHITAINTDSLDYLEKNQIKADWLYTDPARRGAQQEKVVRLSACTPDIVQNLELLYRTSENIMIKTSPLLDIDLAVKELGGVTEVYIVGLGNECKELLFILNQKTNSIDNYVRKARLLDSNGSVINGLSATILEEQISDVEYSSPLAYLYEPHAAILKGGFLRKTASHFQLKKIAANSHLYTSENLITGFPGRTFKVLTVYKPDPKLIQEYIEGDKANVTIRNFPGTVQEFRKKMRLKEGGDFYLFATTLSDQKRVVIITEKV